MKSMKPASYAVLLTSLKSIHSFVSVSKIIVFTTKYLSLVLLFSAFCSVALCIVFIQYMQVYLLFLFFPPEKKVFFIFPVCCIKTSSHLLSKFACVFFLSILPIASRSCIVSMWMRRERFFMCMCFYPGGLRMLGYNNHAKQ